VHRVPGVAGMFVPIPGLPPHVVGFTAEGRIHSDDYTRTLIPAVEEQIRQEGRARVLLVLGPAWEGHSPGAMVEDAKLGIEHLRAWERFALVSDAGWIADVAKLFGWLVPGEVRSFPTGELDAATAWVSA
jgi:hypothetical protein